MSAVRCLGLLRTSYIKQCVKLAQATTVRSHSLNDGQHDKQCSIINAFSMYLTTKCKILNTSEKMYLKHYLKHIIIMHFKYKIQQHILSK